MHLCPHSLDRCSITNDEGDPLSDGDGVGEVGRPS